MAAMTEITSIGRYYFHEISPSVASQFKVMVGGRSFTDARLDTAVSSVLVPHVTEVLQAVKLALASNYRSEAERQTFIATKARELGVNASHLERVFDFTMVGIPYITSYSPCRKDEPGHVTGGIIWYELDLRGQRVLATRMETISADEDLICLEKDHSMRFVGYSDALSVRMRDLDVFRMSTQILSIGGNTIRMSIGKEDGLSIDELYSVEEDVQEKDNETVQSKRRGWARVSKLYDETAPGPIRGEAKIVAASRRIRPGMRLVEIPRGRTHVGVGAFYLRYRISEGVLRDRDRIYLHVPSGGWRQAIGVVLEADANIAKVVNTPQVFFGLRFGAGLTTLDATFYDGRYRESDVGSTPTWAVIGDLGLSKRFYIRSVGVALSARYGFAAISTSFDLDTARTDLKESSFSLVGHGPQVDVGVSFWIDPRAVVLFLGEYRHFRSEDWSVQTNDRDRELDKSLVPKVRFDAISARVVTSFNLEL